MLKCERFVLREWREEDLVPFAEMNGDREVMEFFPAVLSREESDALARRIMGEMGEFGLWAAEIDGEFAGYIGLRRQEIVEPNVEIGWRLARKFWGKGYATEGARKVLEYGSEIAVGQVASFTAVENVRSRRVMEKIGMHQVGFFEHPKLPVGHPLRRHVLYVT